MTKYILTDIDQTVLNFGDPFQDWLEARGYDSFGRRLCQYYSVENVFGLDTDTVRSLVEEYQNSESFADLPALPDAAVVLPELHARGFEFVAITASIDEIDIVAKRRRNLEKAFGFEWKAVHHVGLDGGKRGILRSYADSIWVEDNAVHADTGAQLGHLSFLLHRPYNGSLPSRAIRIQDWFDIKKLIDAAPILVAA